MNSYTVVVQRWIESERGWGQRPDGFTLHTTAAVRDAYVAQFTGGYHYPAPDTYSLPAGDPFFTNVDAGTHGALVANPAHTIWFGPHADLPAFVAPIPGGR